MGFTRSNGEIYTFKDFYLTLFGLERRSGILEVRSGERSASLRLFEGNFLILILLAIAPPILLLLLYVCLL